MLQSIRVRGLFRRPLGDYVPIHERRLANPLWASSLHLNLSTTKNSHPPGSQQPKQTKTLGVFDDFNYGPVKSRFQIENIIQFHQCITDPTKPEHIKFLQNKQSVERKLAELALYDESYKNSQILISILTYLNQNHYLILLNDSKNGKREEGLIIFISNLLRYLQNKPFTFTLNHEIQLQLIFLSSELIFPARNLSSSNLLLFHQWIHRFIDDSLSSSSSSSSFFQNNFTNYSRFFYTFARLGISWSSFDENHRAILLDRFAGFVRGDISLLPLDDVIRFIWAVDNRLILKSADMSKAVLKESYSKLLDDAVRRLYIIPPPVNQQKKVANKELEKNKEDSNTVENKDKKEDGPNKLLIKRLSMIRVFLSQYTQLFYLNPSRILSHHQLKHLCQGLESEWKDFKISDQTQCIVNLGELSVSFDKIPSHIWKRVMIEDLTMKLPTIKPSNLSYLIKGFIKQEYYWSDMTLNLQKILLKQFETILSLISPMTNNGNDELDTSSIQFQRLKEAWRINNFIFYLSELKIIWSKDIIYMKEFIPIFFTALERGCHDLQPHELSNMLLHLSQLELSWENMPEKVQLALLKAIRTQYSDMREKEIENTLFGLDKLRWAKSEETDLIKKKLLHQLFQPSESYQRSSFTLFDLLNHLKMTEYDWKDDKVIRDLLFNKIIHSYSHRSKIILSHVDAVPSLLYNIASVRLKWSEMKDDNLKKALLNGIEDFCERGVLSKIKIDNFLFGLRLIEIKKEDLPISTRDFLLDLFIHRLGSVVNGPEIWSPLYTFKQIGVTWADLPVRTRITFTRLIVKNFRSFSNHDLSMVMHSLFSMSSADGAEWRKYDLTQLHLPLIERSQYIRRRDAGRMNPIHIERIEEYVRWFDQLPPSKRPTPNYERKKEVVSNEVKEEKNETETAFETENENEKKIDEEVNSHPSSTENVTEITAPHSSPK